jgi:EAL domain-containing protein (putative c-di-GMP-specific phosphodiesterase class I)
MSSNQNNLAIIRSTLDLGHNLGLEVIAEGVETREACMTLKSLGCDMAQGNYFGPPVPAEQIMEKLTALPVEMQDLRTVAAR